MNKDAFELFGTLADISRQKRRQESKFEDQVELLKGKFEEQSEEKEKLARKNIKLKEKLEALEEELLTKQDRIDELECEEPSQKKSRRIKTEYESDNGSDDESDDEIDDETDPETAAKAPIYVVQEKGMNFYAFLRIVWIRNLDNNYDDGPQNKIQVWGFVTSSVWDRSRRFRAWHDFG